MTFEQRMDRLTERHEALAQSVELLVGITRENSENTQKLIVATNQNTSNIDKLIAVTNQDGEHIRALVRIAELHERRITDIGG